MNVHTLIGKAWSIVLLTATLLALASCDDDATTLGYDMMPAADLLEKRYDNIPVVTSSYAVDSVLSRNSMSYIGRFTDPETKSTVKSDFMAQFHCNDNFAFPDSIVGNKCTGAELRLFIDSYVGDPLTTFKISVYQLDSLLDPEVDYYTNIDPDDFYDTQAEPIATKWFTITDYTISDDDRESDNYYNNIRIALPETIATSILEGYRRNPANFRNADTWLKSGLPGSKGFYFKLEHGDGAMVYIDVAQFNLYFRYHDNELDADTLGICQFAATEEVVQATRFVNDGIKQLVGDNGCTYIKSPAGVFTMAEIPADAINMNDTINSARITFTRYNDTTSDGYRIDIPKTLLMVRLDDYLNGYFEKYKTPDDITSYITNFDAKKNSYTYSNIARLVKTMVNERDKGTATANWNKVLLIPVEKTTDSGGTIVKVNHDFSISGTRLVGGSSNNVQLEVIYSRFK